MTNPKQIFVSYSHSDDVLSSRVFNHLKNLEHSLSVETWIDKNRIRAGDKWLPEIEKALDKADLALLLISPSFLSSDFIMQKELPKLRQRRERDELRIIPLLVEQCGWGAIEWLREMELRPYDRKHGIRALSEINEETPAQVDRTLGRLIEEIAQILTSEGTHAHSTEGDPGSERHMNELSSVNLLCDVLLQQLAEEPRMALAKKLVEAVVRHTSLHSDAAFDAVRFFIEYQLLNAEEPTSPLALEQSLGGGNDSDAAKRLLNHLKQRARRGDFSGPALEVNSRFFLRARDREKIWRTYFEALVKAGMRECEVTSLCRIRIKFGFLSPQFLVAGLLSHCDDDWRPVLNAYQKAIPDTKQNNGQFESLQASQWNCWLTWGPSIPLCQCEQWKGLFAFQYGYGDENNSLPVIETAVDAKGLPKTFEPIMATLNEEKRRAKPTQLSGRLRWAPWFLRGQSIDEPREPVIDITELDGETPAEELDKYGAALAQASLYTESGYLHNDGLVLHLETVDLVVAEKRVYFSSYLWLMFLVAGPAKNPSVGPSLLRGKNYPKYPEREDERSRVIEARLWEDLLPVFVHANIADPAALMFQKEALVSNALQLLQRVWHSRDAMFDSDDVEAGIQFYLVCGSDYGGCGHQIRYPLGSSLVELLRQCLANEQNREFAESVVLPHAGENDKPWGLAGYFSACHLPDMISYYYEHVLRSSQARS